ncbi:MAG TPA: GDP-mannose 4,6-dehydratase, partial [Candidatus Hydrogenedentes bacterium]|nr:GDP-mannose 4,6-dehydratase [Candidatus Hydrogenedentota bacterium]
LPVPRFGDGSTRRDYTYIDDCVEGVVRAIDTPFRYEIFNLGESQTTSLQELIELVARHVGKEPNIDVKPLQPGDVTITYANIDKARRMLGYNPKTGMDEGIRRFVAWYRERNTAPA